jgi:hypothetical protein
VSHDTGPHLPVGEGSGTITCPTAPDSAFLPMWTPALPRVPRHRTPPPCWGGLCYCHVSFGSRPHLPVGVGSSAAMCLVASDSASLLGRAPTPPCVLWLLTLPPCREGFRCCHASYDSLWAMGLEYKERSSWPTYAARLVCFHGTRACSQGT